MYLNWLAGSNPQQAASSNFKLEFRASNFLRCTGWQPLMCAMGRRQPFSPRNVRNWPFFPFLTTFFSGVFFWLNKGPDEPKRNFDLSWQLQKISVGVPKRSFFQG